MWTPTLLPVDVDGPVFLRLADAVVADVRRGRLAPGDRLPSTRQLARSLGLNRNTVVAAYRELRAQGWVTARAGAPHRVAELPGTLRPAPAPRELGFDLAPVPRPVLDPPVPPGTLVMAGGRPDLRLLPTDELARCWREALRTAGRRLLDYGDPRGTPRLREALATMLAAERGLAVSPDGVVVTRGSQMGLYLVARALIRPGDRVAVEDRGYPPAWDALRAAGAELVPLPVDGDGLDPAELAALLPLRAIYCTPHHQFPTMATLPGPRRMALLAFAARHRVAVIEDDYDHDFHYRGRPVHPLAAHDPHGVVVYVGTLSKVLAPGLRIGFVVAAPALLEALCALRIAVDRQGDQVTEHAVARWIEDGGLRRHIRRMRRVYGARQEHLVSLLEALPVDVDVPAGGLALWVRAPTVDVERWSAAAVRSGVSVRTARTYRLDGEPERAFRAGFAALDLAGLEEAVRRLASAVPPGPVPVGRAHPVLDASPL